MRSLALPILCSLAALPVDLADAVRLGIIGTRVPQRSVAAHQRRASIVGTTGLTNSADIQYNTNITVGGSEFQVIIDTGRSVSPSMTHRDPETHCMQLRSLCYRHSSEQQGHWKVGDRELCRRVRERSVRVSSCRAPRIKSIHKVPFTWPRLNSRATPSRTRHTVSRVWQRRGCGFADRSPVQQTPSGDNAAGTGLIGLGPNFGSQVFDAIGDSSGDAVLDRIFKQNTSTPNYITILLGRHDDPTDTFPGDLTVGEILPGYEAVTSQPKLNVSQVAQNTIGNQHWQTLLDADGVIGPDGEAISVTTGVSGTSNKKQLTAVFDSGFSLPQVPRCVMNALFIHLRLTFSQRCRRRNLWQSAWCQSRERRRRRQNLDIAMRL